MSAYHNDDRYRRWRLKSEKAAHIMRYGFCPCCGNRNLEHRCYCDGDHTHKGCNA